MVKKKNNPRLFDTLNSIEITKWLCTMSASLTFSTNYMSIDGLFGFSVHYFRLVYSRLSPLGFTYIP